MKILIIDGNNWAHRSYHAMERMEYKGVKTGGIWGFFNILAGNIGKHKPDKIFVCWDDGRNPNRMKLLPGYKKREPKLGFDREDFQKQMKAIKRMVKLLGIAQLWDKNSEADDFIYALVKKYSAKRKNKIIVASGDKDFRQLVTDRVLISDEKWGLISPLNFKRLFNIDPCQYSDYLSLMGDNSDKIPGVKGYGEKTTLKFLEQYGSMKGYLQSNPEQSLKHSALCITYSINNRLINLKHFDMVFGPIPITYYKGLKKPKLKKKKYLELCSKYGIRKFATAQFFQRLP